MKTPCLIESLEPRIAPALLFVNATTATYTDIDGDLVTVKFTKPILTDSNVGSILQLGSGSLIGDSLTKVALAGHPEAQGTRITITAKPQNANPNQDHFLDGDGVANFRFIDATGLDLGTVNIHGDLVQLIRGSDALHQGLLKLAALYLRRYHVERGVTLHHQDGTTSTGRNRDRASPLNSICLTARTMASRALVSSGCTASADGAHKQTP